MTVDFPKNMYFLENSNINSDYIIISITIKINLK